ncbi:MAG: microcin C ABC transporter permease YejB [Pseudomonadota bacterium]
MLDYIIRRLALIPVTLLGIMLVTFVLTQFLPGGPIEQLAARLDGTEIGATARVSGEANSDFGTGGGQAGEGGQTYRGARGLPPELIAELEAQYGFDKPPFERFLHMMGRYIQLDFGESFFRDRTVVDLVIEKLPVSISLGLWATLITYLVCIPLGIAKAVRDGSRFDIWTSAVIIVGYAIPSFLFAILLIVVFAGGQYFDWFPLRGLTSSNWEELSLWGKVVDYAWHMTLPLLALVIGGFASLTMLTKNSFLDEIGKQYVTTAKAKGLAQKTVLYGHVFRNAMLIVIAGFPGAFIGILFTGALLIEIIFSLDGLGLLGFEALVNRDYPIVFATLFFFSLLGLVVQLISDLVYTLVDPRIDFEGR